VALHAEVQVLGRHAVPVILDQHAADAALLQLHADLAGAGVEGVLHQLLHHGGRTLHHLAGGDAVGGGVGEEADHRLEQIVRGGRPPRT